MNIDNQIYYIRPFIITLTWINEQPKWIIRQTFKYWKNVYFTQIHIIANLILKKYNPSEELF